MGHRGLSQQVEHVRDQIDKLKSSLDQTMQSIEDLSSKTSDLAHEARQVADVLGEERPSGVPWGLLLTLALGAGIVYLISPDVITSIRDFITAQYQSIAGPTERRMP